MKAVYIAHPLNAPTREGIEANRARASRWVAWAAEQGVCPRPSSSILTGEWDETPENRSRGLAIDFAQIERCDEFWVCGPHVSNGMRAEMGVADGCGVLVIDKLTDDGEPPAIAEKARKAVR